MNEEPREKLREIIVKYGLSVCNDRERCKGLLLDYCSEYRGEVHVLIAALEEQVVVDLLNTSKHVPQEMLLSRLTEKLYQNKLIDKEAARWGVESWALALGMTLQEKPRGLKPGQSQQTTQSQPSAFATTTLADTTSDSSINLSGLPISSAPNTVPSRPARNRPTSASARRRYNISSTPQTTLNSSTTSNFTPSRANSISSTPNTTSNTPTTPSRQTTTQTTYRPPTIRSRSSSRPIRTLFLTTLCCVLVVLGARTQVYLHLPFYHGLNGLLAVAVYLTSAILDGRRGFIAMLLYLGLGAIGLPVFLAFPLHPTWSVPDYLYFLNGAGGWTPLRVPFYYTCPIVALIVGSIFNNNRDMSYWTTLWVLLLGQILFSIGAMLDNILLFQASLPAAFQALFPSQYGSLILMCIVAIPIRMINAARD